MVGLLINYFFNDKLPTQMTILKFIVQYFVIHFANIAFARIFFFIEKLKLRTIPLPGPSVNYQVHCEQCRNFSPQGNKS